MRNTQSDFSFDFIILKLNKCTTEATLKAIQISEKSIEFCCNY